jgi:hypothetical protein
MGPRMTGPEIQDGAPFTGKLPSHGQARSLTAEEVFMAEVTSVLSKLRFSSAGGCPIPGANA